MRRLHSITDDMRDIVTYEFDDGRCIAFSGRDLRKYGISEMLKQYGVEQPTGRVDVFWGGKKVGTVPAYFDPQAAKSSSWLYDIRPGDFTRTERGWEAVPQLGPGDLEAIPEFVWDDRDQEAGRPQRAEEDRAILMKALTASVDMLPKGQDRETGLGAEQA